MAAKVDGYRVYYLGKLRDRIKKARGDKRQQDFFRDSLDRLPALVDSLLAMGFGPGTKKGPSKIPVEQMTLKALRRASAQTGIPQTSLVQACLSLSVADAAKPRKAKARPRKRAKAKG